MIGSSLAHYRITERLGAGGMGEVYRATDTKLGRDVAIKVLPPALAADAERLERFEREARAVAALNHPNIVTIHAVDEADGVRFLAMELVDGEPLEMLIPLDAGMPLPRLLEIAVPLADALAAAHEKRVVHRDLKPANIMVTKDGRPKILDFGLAKLLQDDTSGGETSRLETLAKTQEGVVMGTVPYMSPEQVEGRSVDHRTDVFSLGVILYEMAVGTRPFAGGSSPALMSAILRDTPRPVHELRPELPERLGRLVARCLEKSVGERIQTARDVLNELRAVRAASTSGVRAGSGPRRSREREYRIAVLPFKCASADPELVSFTDALAEDVTAGLSRFPYLSVVAHASTLRFRSQPDLRATGAELGARFVLEGGVRRGGSTVRVAAQLADVETGAQLWAETYNRDTSKADLMTAGDEVVDRVVATVADSHGVLMRSIVAALDELEDDELTPAEWGLRSFRYNERLTSAEHAPMRSGLERAVEREARNASLWACLAKVFLDEYSYGFNAGTESLERALAAARRAIEIDRTSELGYQALAGAHFLRRDVAAFRVAAERAIELNPRNSTTLALVGLRLVLVGDAARGGQIARRAMELNPHHAGWYHLAPVWEHFRKAEYALALEPASRVNMPGFFWQHLAVAAICGHLGRRAEGAAAVKDLLAADPDFPKHARERIEAWHYASGLTEPILEGLRKAGLPMEDMLATPKPASAPSQAPGAREERSLAVLPFTNLSGDASDEYFSDGVTEEIQSALAQVAGLRVAARTSSFAFKGRGHDLSAVAEKLHVAHVLTGSIRRAGSRLRIAAQLADVASGFESWSETYDRELVDVFAIQDEIAAAIAAKLRVKLAPDGEARERRGTSSLEAYDAFLRGLAHQRRRGRAILSALECFERAIALDPDYADAHAFLADSHRLLAVYGQRPANEAMPVARTAAERALALDPNVAEAYATLADVACVYDRDDEAAFRAWDRALALDPRHARARSERAVWGFIVVRDDRERAMAEARLAVEADPLAAWVAAMHAWALALAGRFDEGVSEAWRAVGLDGEATVARWTLVEACLCAGRASEAAGAAEGALVLSRRLPMLLGPYAAALARSGRADEATAIHQELLSRADYVSPTWLSATALAAGRPGEALTWLEKAVDDRDPMALLVRVLPEWEPLRGRPEFAALLARLGLKP